MHKTILNRIANDLKHVDLYILHYLKHMQRVGKAPSVRVNNPRPCC